MNEGRPNAVDLMKGGAIQLVIYTPAGAHSFSDEKAIRRTAIAYRLPCITTMSAAKAVAEVLASRRRDPLRVWSLQPVDSKRLGRNWICLVKMLSVCGTVFSRRNRVRSGAPIRW